MIYEITVSQFIKMLKNLDSMLDKTAHHAEVKKFDPMAILEARLAPDQFNFTRQIQILCDTAKKCAAQLTGKDAPALPDTEKSIPELKKRLAGVVSYLESFSESDYKAASERHVSQARWEGKYLTGHEFVVQHAIPNFYFHLTTAYSILRHNGLDVGKKDYLGTMPYKK
ncbi:MAG: DUF1993 domain-containing protein [Proteobacteria bacterium]|nr:DUF1993 domain-containing protein [Pseudomonadota bacterium]